MDSKKGLRNWFGEWISSHTLWELARHLVGTVGAAWLGSYAWSHLMHAALDTAANVFLLVLGILGVAWGIGLIPVRKKEKVSPLRESLLQKCDAILLGWKELAEQYQNAPKDEGHSPTLPNPMDPGWAGYGFKVWPYKVGVLQGRTNALREDLVRAGIQVEKWDYAHITMVQLIHALEKYRSAIG